MSEWDGAFYRYQMPTVEINILQGRIFIFFKGGVEKLLVGCKQHH
jgi:hypothetical protein